MDRKVKVKCYGGRKAPAQYCDSRSLLGAAGFWAIAVLFCFCLGGKARADQVRVTCWDGAVIQGEWTGSQDGTLLELNTETGAKAVAIDEVAIIEFGRAIESPFGPQAFHLQGGGMLFGAMSGSLPEAVQARTAIGDVTIGWSHLAAIRLGEPTQFRRASQLFEETIANRSPSEDALVSRDKADVKVLRGRLESLDEKGGSFHFSGETRKFQNEKIFAVIFAAGASAPSPQPASLELTDGSRVSGKLTSADESGVRLETGFGANVEIPFSSIARLRFRSQRVQYVSELKPADQKIEGVLHAPWPVGSDRSVMGAPISIGGQSFERGLGVHSRTELTYSIKAEFEQFAATIGIDDAVRPLGDVVMKVLGDGKTLFDSGPLRGADPPRPILVDVRGVQSLTLLVDYGEGLDASDHANWADARLLRPAKSKASKQ